jgi:hypothetical protein
MNKLYGSIALALGCLVAGTALAQQTYDSDQPSQPDQQGQAAPQQGATDQMPTGSKEQKKQQQAAQKQTGQPMAQIESQGVALSQLDEQQITELQRSLQEAGYYTGTIDGKVGQQTKQALRKFYSDQAQLASKGMILPQGAAALGLDQAEIERVRGLDQGATQPARVPGGAEEQQPQQQPQQPQGMQQPEQQQQQPQHQGTHGTGAQQGQGMEGGTQQPSGEPSRTDIDVQVDDEPQP